MGPGTESAGITVGPKLLLVEVRKDEPGREINESVSRNRTKKCNHPHKGAEGPKNLP